MSEKTQCIVLAGGRSSRFVAPDGNVRNKYLMPLKGKRTIDWVVHSVLTVFSSVTVVSNDPISFTQSSIRVIADGARISTRSSLYGIYNALSLAKGKRVMIVAGDMPFIHSELIAYLNRIEHSADLLIPEVNHFLQPMPAVYSPTCLSVVEDQVTVENYRILDIFNKLSLSVVTMEEVVKLDPFLGSFFNMNSWADYEHAIQYCNTMLNPSIY
jgi:molybdopterin-guanine dinucleotide biosynthesis protein A